MAQLEEQDLGSTCRVRVSGEVDLAFAEEFQARLQDCLERYDHLELDLGEVTFIDSSGLGSLVLARNEAQKRSKSVSLVNLSPMTLRLLHVTGLQQVFGVDGAQA